MKKRNVIALAAAALLAGACIPSVHPYYEPNQVVYEPALIGHWIDATDTSAEPQTWDFEKAQDNAYKLLITEKEGKKGAFQAHLFKLGDERFLDLTPAEVHLATNEADTVSAALIPGHLLFHVLQTEPALKLAFIDGDWLQKYLEGHPAELAHAKTDDRLVLTATTKELQAFILRHLAKDKLFGDPGEFRKSTPEKK